MIDNDKTYITYGLVLSMDLEDIPDLKAYLSKHGIRIVYQKKTATERITIISEPWTPEEIGRH